MIRQAVIVLTVNIGRKSPYDFAYVWYNLGSYSYTLKLGNKRDAINLHLDASSV
jgi:hypothetical protein